MRVRSVHISNFRAFKNQKVDLDSYTCLLGANGVGKSAVVAALDLFFGGHRNVSESDYHQKNTSIPIRITLTFQGLSDDAKADFKHYVRGEDLTVFVEATWNAETKSCRQVRRGVRRGLAEFAALFDMSAGNLKGKYSELREDSRFAQLPAYRNKDDALQSLRHYEASHLSQCVDIESREEFFGTTGLALISKHVYWVHVPAVKDASSEASEGSNWLGRLLQHAMRRTSTMASEVDKIRKDAEARYSSVLEGGQAELKEFSKQMCAKLREWSHPNAEVELRWNPGRDGPVRVNPPLAIVEAGDQHFIGDISLQGHGFQRSYLIALVQMLAEAEGGRGPSLLLACEEPELYQHPPQAQYLASALRRIAETSAQVIVCTHSPYFATGDQCDAIRLVRRGRDGASMISLGSNAAISSRLQALGRANQASNASGSKAKLKQLLQPSASELFFARAVVLVEGLEDQAYLLSYLHITGKDDQFRRLGGHIVHCDGKDRMVFLLAVAKCFDIPVFCVLDGDRRKCHPESGETDTQKLDRCALERSRHEPDNRAILDMCGDTGVQSFPLGDYYGDRIVVWQDDIGASVDACAVSSMIQAAKQLVKQSHSLHSESGLNKNGMFIGLWMEELMVNKGGLISCLQRCCARVLEFARTV